MLTSSESSTATEILNASSATPLNVTQPAEEFTGMSVNCSTFTNPPSGRGSIRKRSHCEAYTVPRCDSNSPHLDVFNSPKIRDLQREREIRSLRKQLHEMEDHLAASNSQVTESKRRIECYIAEIMKKKERIHELEASEKLLSRERDELESTLKSTTHQLDQIRQQSESQQQRLEKYKSSSDVWEAKKVELSEQLKAKSRTLLQTERQLRDIKDEFSVVQEVNRTLEIENDSLKKILEETKQSAEVEREQYENSVCDLRRRCESEAAENISLYTCEMGKNAALQRDIREKSEEIEALHKQYDSMKKHMESTIEDMKKIYQEKLDKATKRIAEVEAELVKQEEKHKCLEATVQQLEGAHLTETNRRESKIRATRTRVTELESRLVECDRIVLEQRKQLVSLTAEKDEFESKVSNLKTTLLDKDSQLCDANSSVEQLKRSLRSTEQDYREAIRTVENLRSHVSQLQLYADQKDSEIVSMQQRIDDLTSLTELHSNLDAELEKLRSDLEKQLNKNEELELIFKEKLEQLEMKNAKHAEKITQLESCIETAKRAASESEERKRIDGDEKEARHSKLLSALCEKVNTLEEDVAKYTQKNAKLRARIVELEEENEQYVKCVELSSIHAGHGSLRKRFPNAPTTETLKRATAASIINSLFEVNEDEPEVMLNVSTKAKEVMEEVKGSPVVNNRRRKPVVIKPLPTDISPDECFHSSASTLSKSTAARSSVLLNKDGSDLKIAMDQSSPAKLLIRNEENLAEQRSTKSSRSNTLDQKTSAIKTASNISHSEKENAVKYGSTRGRRRSGVKLLERASSYVKKRLSISESTFVNRNQ